MTGWTREGLATWDEAVRRVRYLTEEGTTLAATPQDVWRLPTREEVVRSMTRGGHSAEGVWDPVSGRASYGRRPDKESPLWDRFAPLIYLWTAEEGRSDLVLEGKVIETSTGPRLTIHMVYVP